jgi:hypothetical protein
MGAASRSVHRWVPAVLGALLLVGCGPDREEADRMVARHRPPPPSAVELLCTVVDQALPYLQAEHRTIVDLVGERTAEAAGDGAIIAYGRYATEGHFGPYEPALRYLVRLYAEEAGPVARQPPPSPEVVASARAIDRVIASGRCR